MRNLLLKVSTGDWTLLSGVSLVFALLFSGAGLFSYQHSRVFSHNARMAAAEVVEVKDRSPVFQYQVDGNTFEYQPSEGPLTKATLGDSTTLYFNSENPSEVREVTDIKSQTESWLTTALLGLSGMAWTLLGLCSFMRYQARRRSVGMSEASSIETACTFVALEGTMEKAQTARRIRLICRWVHPETGEEWVLKSPALHPADLPPRLEVGSTLRCRVNFDDPAHHEVQVA
ncbi:MAG: DUF3592 domain-containing protein [Bdellovibrionales bacterium]|nr:DUF3592 domain-containing protein [Bdellovibrionales bacterium]